MRRVQGMAPYNPNPEVGYGCASCINNTPGCSVPCEPNSSGGTGYKWNKKATHKVFWIRKKKV